MPSTSPTQIDRAAINHANSQYSTGPRTDAGNGRSALNALRRCLTARSRMLLPEDQPHTSTIAASSCPVSSRELHKYEGVPRESSGHGFVFSKDQCERFSQTQDAS
jgi:hypothetical protein